ncbi:MAG: type II toxin-antitoxin system VapC family toxin [Armatimonadetes bacterium]|nr:type II toxin-antitoxin system VapC family toxin [Armatimonadota bacterium]
MGLSGIVRPRGVIDASVGILTTPLGGEPIHERLAALSLFDDIRSGLIEAHIPDRWADEVGAALWEAVTRKRYHAFEMRPILPHEAQGWFMDLLAFADTYMHWHYRDWTPDEVWAMASVKGCSYYDAIYLVLAQKLGAVFWTADRRLYEFLRRYQQLNQPSVRWIGDYPRKS